MIASLVVLAQRLALLTLFLREMASTRSTLMSASSAALALTLALYLHLQQNNYYPANKRG